MLLYVVLTDACDSSKDYMCTFYALQKVILVAEKKEKQSWNSD